MLHLKQTLRDAPESFTELREACAQNANAYAAVQNSGLRLHPTVQTLLAREHRARSNFHRSLRKFL
eukprot:13916923-Alexandrium_andersonii.AAC.1